MNTTWSSKLLLRRRRRERRRQDESRLSTCFVNETVIVLSAILLVVCCFVTTVESFILQVPSHSSFTTTKTTISSRHDKTNFCFQKRQKYSFQHKVKNDNGDDNIKGDDDKQDPVFYDDFGGQVIGGGGGGVDDSAFFGSSTSSFSSSSSSSTTKSVLQERIQTMQRKAQQQEALVLQNWKRGNWKVRGFSLDPENSNGMNDDDEDMVGSSSSRIHVCLVQSDRRKSNNFNTDFSEESSTSAAAAGGLVWIGRTDGSLLAVRLGTEYWTKFQSKLTAEVVDEEITTTNDTESTNSSRNTVIRFSSQLVRDDSGDLNLNNDEYDEDDDEVEKEEAVPAAPTTPFQIVAQVQAGSSPLSAMLVWKNDDDDDDHEVDYSDHGDESSYLWTACQGSGDIQQWLRSSSSSSSSENDNEEAINLVAAKVLTGVHSQDTTVIALQAVGMDTDVSSSIHPKVLFSAARDGTMALWDAVTGDLLYQCTIPSSLSYLSSSTELCSATTDGVHVFCGTSEGQILVYRVQEWLESAASTMTSTACPTPNGLWLAAADDVPITSVATAGAGTLGRQQQSAGGGAGGTVVLLTGDANGVVKQWEVLSRNVDVVEEDGSSNNRMRRRLEQWPKMSTQRLPKKAHVMKRQHEGPVTALQAVDATKFVSASADGTIRAWNSMTGQELFRMDGFVEEKTTQLSAAQQQQQRQQQQQQQANDYGGVVQQPTGPLPSSPPPPAPPIKSLCLQSPTLLITDGMKQYVCVHDFNVDPDEYKDYGLEMDDDW